MGHDTSHLSPVYCWHARRGKGETHDTITYLGALPRRAYLLPGKLVELYRQNMREDRGDYDWSVLVKSAALGQVNEEIPPQALLERVRQGAHRQDEALLEYDLSWLGQELEGLWVFARLYLAGSMVPAAVVHRIDFAEEDAESLLNKDFEEVNDERSLDEE